MAPSILFSTIRPPIFENATTKTENTTNIALYLNPIPPKYHQRCRKTPPPLERCTKNWTASTLAPQFDPAREDINESRILPPRKLPYVNSRLPYLFHLLAYSIARNHFLLRDIDQTDLHRFEPSSCTLGTPLG